jgi:hypothetical protein
MRRCTLTLPLRVGLGRRVASPLLATLTTLTDRVGGVLDAFACEFDVSRAKQRRPT